MNKARLRGLYTCITRCTWLSTTYDHTQSNIIWPITQNLAAGNPTASVAGGGEYLPLSLLVDLLRWPLGLSQFWYLAPIGMLLWTGMFAVLAWKSIYPKLLQ